MWEPTGRSVRVDTFSPLVPQEVLLQFEGPRTFTTVTRSEDLLLAHQCDEEGEIMRFLVVPFSQELLRRLIANKMPIRDALNQPWIWLVDVGVDWHPRAVWSVRWADIPDEVLPFPGVTLHPKRGPVEGLSKSLPHLAAGQSPMLAFVVLGNQRGFVRPLQ